jgi:hypothetical protein
LNETSYLCGPFTSGFNNTSNPLQAQHILSCANAANAIISNGAVVIAEASHEINLEPGFEAEDGSRFEAMIVSECNQLKSAKEIESKVIENDTLKESINVFPNPVKEIVFIQFKFPYETTNDISIYNITGSKVYQSEKFKMMEGIKLVNISNYKSGIYIMNIYSNGKVSKHKIIVK